MQWVKPELVAQIRFVEWTAEGHLRHAAFLGLRRTHSCVGRGAHRHSRLASPRLAVLAASRRRYYSEPTSRTSSLEVFRAHVQYRVRPYSRAAAAAVSASA
jgi:hypothetical protein